MKAPASGDRGSAGAEVGDRLRVFHLIKGLGRGGAEMLLAEGLRLADRKRFDYSFGYFLPAKHAMVGALEAQGAPVECFGAGGNPGILASAGALAAFLVRNRVDVMHCHLPMTGVVGRVAGRRAGIPVVYTEHNLQERYHFLTRTLNRLTWRLQDRVVAVSSDVKASILANIGGQVPVQVVLNGVDVDRFCRGAVDRGAVRRQLGIPASAPVVGTVAVFRTQKRLDDWLRAARRVLDQRPDTRFVIVGDGPLKQEIEGRRAALGLEGAVYLPGLRDDVRPYLAAMDVYMMSSLFEGLPVALLEAMSMECAVAATSVGGIPEVIDHRANGLLVEAQRPDLLGDSVAHLLAQPARRQAMASAGRNTVVERFSLERMTGELEAIYLEAAAGHRRP